jgi:hypothetical protein
MHRRKAPVCVSWKGSSGQIHPDRFFRHKRWVTDEKLIHCEDRFRECFWRRILPSIICFEHRAQISHPVSSAPLVQSPPAVGKICSGPFLFVHVKNEPLTLPTRFRVLQELPWKGPHFGVVGFSLEKTKQPFGLRSKIRRRPQGSPPLSGRKEPPRAAQNRGSR